MGRKNSLLTTKKRSKYIYRTKTTKEKRARRMRQPHRDLSAAPLPLSGGSLELAIAVSLLRLRTQHVAIPLAPQIELAGSRQLRANLALRRHVTKLLFVRSSKAYPNIEGAVIFFYPPSCFLVIF